jgi:hypothetical protein
VTFQFYDFNSKEFFMLELNKFEVEESGLSGVLKEGNGTKNAEGGSSSVL